ncbi:MAG: DUF2157 domain-containing protein [Candidatus Sulfopaludibacter sp.]|nr:DUF2157 domain-containing protein [Candidatus Sulfopaludibacter sp.]
MSADWEAPLRRWIAAGLLEAQAAERIRNWERGRAPSQGLRWPVWVALVFGVILVGAGVLLFVSAHWDELSPGRRLTLVLLILASFHAAGAATAERFAALAMALHTVGTLALGAAIALTGQMFELQEHWPMAVLMWAVCAALAWWILGHWTQAVLAAVLFPYWLVGEWALRYQDNYLAPVSAGICALSVTYLTARRASRDAPLRKALAWLGGVALIPAAAVLAAGRFTRSAPLASEAIGWTIGLGAPLAIALWLRGRDAVWNVGAVVWIVGLAALNRSGGNTLPIYLWCALGAAALAVWGIREGRSERVNLGIAGFAIVVLTFYFSSVMDKLGRSVSLMGLGLLFLGGGWLLEKTRRRLIAQVRAGA